MLAGLQRQRVNRSGKGELWQGRQHAQLVAGQAGQGRHGRSHQCSGTGKGDAAGRRRRAATMAPSDWCSGSVATTASWAQQRQHQVVGSLDLRSRVTGRRSRWSDLAAGAELGARLAATDHWRRRGCVAASGRKVRATEELRRWWAASESGARSVERRWPRGRTAEVATGAGNAGCWVASRSQARASRSTAGVSEG